MFRFPQLIINAASNEFASNMPAKQAKGGKASSPGRCCVMHHVWYDIVFYSMWSCEKHTHTRTGAYCSCWPLHKIRLKTLVRVTAAIVRDQRNNIQKEIYVYLRIHIIYILFHFSKSKYSKIMVRHRSHNCWIMKLNLASDSIPFCNFLKKKILFY